MRTDGVHCQEPAGTDRASKPQGSSERVLPWQITIDQSIFASLSHTHYWYEVGMLKVPASYKWREKGDLPSETRWESDFCRPGTWDSVPRGKLACVRL